MENELFETENMNNPFVSFMMESEKNPPESKDQNIQNPQDTAFSSSFLIELVYCIKNTLASIKNFTLLSMDKFDDVAFRKYSYRSITEDIKKIDSVLNSLLNYININTPIIRTNTIPVILERILDANEKQIQDKKIKIFKKFGEDLPETCIHDEQMKFIFDSILQYAILSTPLNGSVGFLIKSFDIQKVTAEKKDLMGNRGGFIEVKIGFVGDKKQVEQLESASEIPPVQKEESINLILQLVKEIIQKNHGMMTIKVDKNRTLITLRFPTERRKVVYYEPITF